MIVEEIALATEALSLSLAPIDADQCAIIESVSGFVLDADAVYFGWTSTKDLVLRGRVATIEAITSRIFWRSLKPYRRCLIEFTDESVAVFEGNDTVFNVFEEFAMA